MVEYVPPTYADAYQAGLEIGHWHALRGGEREPVDFKPGWVSGNMETPYANGWKAGFDKFEEDKEATLKDPLAALQRLVDRATAGQFDDILSEHERHKNDSD